MSLKHFGGALTPSQEFVCFRCRIGWNGPHNRLARRNVQTESQSPSPPLQDILGSIPQRSRDEKSASGATVPRQQADFGKIRRVLSKEDSSHKVVRISSVTPSWMKYNIPLLFAVGSP